MPCAAVPFEEWLTAHVHAARQSLSVHVRLLSDGGPRPRRGVNGKIREPSETQSVPKYSAHLMKAGVGGSEPKLHTLGEPLPTAMIDKSRQFERKDKEWSG
jgi:hypothetical protein